MTTVWQVPFDSVQEWVGPISVYVNGDETTDFKVSFSAFGTLADSWEDPVPHPDAAVEGLGIVIATGSAHPIERNHAYSIKAQVDLGLSEPSVNNVALILATA